MGSPTIKFYVDKMKKSSSEHKWEAINIHKCSGDKRQPKNTNEHEW